MKIEIKNRYTGKIILCGEYENVKDCLDKNSSADLRSANLSSADLSFANLRYVNLSSADLSSADISFADIRSANLSSANLRYANLRCSDLSFADLRSANISYANLSYAKFDKRYIQVACIGSRKGMTTYCFEDDIVWCGCWKGSLEKFEKRVKDTHKNNKKFLKEYLGFIKYVRSLK